MADSTVFNVANLYSKNLIYLYYVKKINISIFVKIFLTLGLVFTLLNNNIIHFDEELLIGLNSLTFF